MGYDRRLSTSFVLMAHSHSPFYSTSNSFRSLFSLVPRVYATSHGSNLLACSLLVLNMWDHTVTTRSLLRSLYTICEFSHVLSCLQFMMTTWNLTVITSPASSRCPLCDNWLITCCPLCRSQHPRDRRAADQIVVRGWRLLLPLLRRRDGFLLHGPVLDQRHQRGSTSAILRSDGVWRGHSTDCSGFCVQ